MARKRKTKFRSLADISDGDLSGISRNLKLTKIAITKKIANTMANALIDLISNAQPRVPVDSGELRESGRATVALSGKGFKTVAKGKKDGTVEKSKENITKEWASGSRTLEGYVSYERFSDEGLDIATWTHEELLPYGSPDHPRARTPGTGPKYLETPFLENQAKYVAMLSNALSTRNLDKSLREYIRKRKGGK